MLASKPKWTDPPLYESLSKYQAVLVFLILSALSTCSYFVLTVDLLTS